MAKTREVAAHRQQCLSLISHIFLLLGSLFLSHLCCAGRELSKLAIAWQAAAYGSDPAVFTPELMESVTDIFLEQKVRLMLSGNVAVGRFCLYRSWTW